MEAPQPKERKEKQIKPPAVPDAVTDVLFRRMDELDALMKPLENQLKPLQSEYKEIAAFLKGCGKAVK